MAKLTLADIANLQNEQSVVNTINANSALIENSLENTLSRDGTSPNQMSADLDMNSRRIINLPVPLSNLEPIRLVDISTVLSTLSVSTLPVGGTAGQILAKIDSTNFNAQWVDSGLSLLPSANVWTATQTINLNAGSVVSYTSNDLLLHTAAGNDRDGFLVFDNFGIGAQSHNADTHLLFRVARGTRAAPTAVGVNIDLSPNPISNGDSYGLIGSIPYGTTGYASTPTSFIVLQPAELQTDTAQGSRVRIGVTRNGTTVVGGGSQYFWSFNNDGQLLINQNSVAPPTMGLNANTKIRLIGANNTAIFSSIEGYGASGNPSFTLMRALGTAASPTVVTSGTVLGGVGFNGYGASGFSSVSGGQLRATAAETWSGGAEGTSLQLMITPTGSTTIATVFSLSQTSTGLTNTLLSNSSGSFAFLGIGRTAFEGSLGVAASGNQFSPGTIAGDFAVQAGTNLWLASSGSTSAKAGIKIDTSGLLTFSQYGTGILQSNASGVVSSSTTLPAITLSGTVSGGGNQINNVVIGASTPLAGSFTTVSASTSITPTNIVGTATNNNASAGSYGEYGESLVVAGSAVSATTSTPKDITSVSLTAGDYEVWGGIVESPAGGTTTTFRQTWISSSSATLPSLPDPSVFALNFSSTSSQIMQSGRKRFSLSGTTTVYLSYYGIFSGGTMGVYGSLQWRRMR